jgi:hypothetical protein
LGRLPDPEDERLSSLAGREDAILMPASARSHNNLYMGYLTSCEVARRADQRSVMMPSTLGELRIEKQPRHIPGKVVAGRATCEEALETSSVLCFRTGHTRSYGPSSIRCSPIYVFFQNSGSLRSFLLKAAHMVLQCVHAVRVLTITRPRLSLRLMPANRFM